MRLYDSFSESLISLPEPPAEIGMYFCGPTVYRRIHVGNAVPFVLSMWLRKWLVYLGYQPTLVINITDINDKIYDAAPNASASLADDATRWYVEDTDRLALGRPDVEPTAAGTVKDQIRLISGLLASQHAYEVAGDVYFRVASFPSYGLLSRQRLDKLTDDDPNLLKESPADFALWKAHKPGEDTSWPSPWGLGRPGWHIECSAMAEKYLGNEFEIHGGGLDLKFPHHENEIAQSRALGHPFAHIWMHNGMLSFQGAEMHKSLRNDVSLRDALDRWGRETLLLFFMTGHWRKPLDYSDRTLRQARSQISAIENGFLAFPWRVLQRHSDTGANVAEMEVLPEIRNYLLQMLVAGSNRKWHPRFPHAGDEEFSVGRWSRRDLVALLSKTAASDDARTDESARWEWGRFVEALSKDFNTPEALRLVRKWVKDGKLGLTYAALNLFGLTSLAGSPGDVPSEVRVLAETRADAKRRGDWLEADRVRSQLAGMGYTVRDIAEPPGYLILSIDDPA